MSNNSPCRSPTRTADRCVGDGANRKKRDLCAPSVHLRSSTPATRPRRTPRATSKKQQGLGIGVTCHLRPGGPRSPRHFLVPTSRYSDARGARAAGAVPLTSAVCTGGYHGARRRERLAQYDPARTESLALLSAAAPAPAAGATAELRRQWTPRCSEVEGRDVMRCFYAQHGSTGALRGGG